MMAPVVARIRMGGMRSRIKIVSWEKSRPRIWSKVGVSVELGTGLKVSSTVGWPNSSSRDGRKTCNVRFKSASWQ